MVAVLDTPSSPSSLPSSLSLAFRDADERVKAYRLSASLAVEKAGGAGGGMMAAMSGGPFGSGGGIGVLGQSQANMAQHQLQYRYFRDSVYTAIRPICMRVTGQSFKVGYQSAAGTAKPGGPKQQKAHEAAMEGDPDAAYWHSLTQFQKSQTLGSAPSFVIKNPDNVDILDAHPFLEAIEDPNDIHTDWALKYITAANLMITAKAFWWFYVGEDGRTQIWPLPATRVEPDPEYGLHAMWKVRLPGMTEAIQVPGEDMLYFALPNPGDPVFGVLGPLQAMAGPISIEEQINKTQLQSYRNGIRPGVILKVGRRPSLPGMPQGDRQTLTPEQRKQLVAAIKYAYAGWEHHGDPAIIDGLIEDIVPWDRPPEEMDFIQSGKHTSNKVHLGFGVNPISTGEREGGNRAQAYVADEHLCVNVVNPLLELMSATITKFGRKRYREGGGDGKAAGGNGAGGASRSVNRPRRKLCIWIEKAKPHDADLELQKWTLAIDAGVVADNEVREYVGKPPRKGGDVTPNEKPPEPPPGVGGQKPGQAEGKPASRKPAGKVSATKPTASQKPKPADAGGKPKPADASGKSAARRAARKAARKTARRQARK